MRSFFSGIQALGISQKEKVEGSDEVLVDEQVAIENQTSPHPGRRHLAPNTAVWCSLVRRSQLSGAGRDGDPVTFLRSPSILPSKIKCVL